MISRWSPYSCTTVAVGSLSLSLSRHTNPGAVSATALIGSSCATNSAISGLSTGARRWAMFSSARCMAGGFMVLSTPSPAFYVNVYLF
ncbi:unnamed protein product [[Actinomadura] parvosata subsp. kistnae]|nr:unnamed protein product [Actinomadura parvosata subsp. kistnae]